MKLGIGLLVGGVLLSLASISSASITDWSCGPDTDGAIDCTAGWNSGSYTLTITGTQYWGPGHMVGDFTTDTDEDPTVGMVNYIDNDTDFAWSDYHVTIYMSKTFTISGAYVGYPTDWTPNTVTVQPPPLAGDFVDSHGTHWPYAGTVDYFAGTDVQIGGMLVFGYAISFAGGISYEQEMYPTPEPATISLLVLGGLAMLRRRRK